MAYVLLLSCLPNVEFLALDSLLCTPAMNDLNIPLDPLGPPSESSHMIFLTFFDFACNVLFAYFFDTSQTHALCVITCVKSTLETSSEKSWDLSHNWMF